MESNWVSQGQIVCKTDAGDQVTVFRMKDVNAPAGTVRDRYVLANRDRVVIESNGDLRIAGTKTILRPITTSGPLFSRAQTEV
jgi:hypothetical protein